MSDLFLCRVNVHCVSGWGWRQRGSEESDLDEVEVLPEFTSERAILVAEGDRLQFISMNLTGVSASYGEKGIIVPIREDEPVSTTIRGVAIYFGNTQLIGSIEEVIKRTSERVPQFEYPETRGFADIVEMVIGERLKTTHL